MPESLADLALSEARRALDSAAAGLADARARAGQTFAVAGVGTSFLADPALKGHRGVPWLGVLAIAALVASTVSVAVALRPRRVRGAGATALDILGDTWAHLDDDPDMAARTLASFGAKHARANEVVLDRVWWAVRFAMAFALLSLCFWLTLLLKGP
jgi:hypothetical protein